MNIFLKITVLMLILFLSLNSCKQHIDIESLKVTKDENGNLQSEIHYINDTLMNGLAKYYYSPNPKNVLKDEINFIKGKKDGWYKHYRKDGTLESKTYFKNNTPDGENYWYYEDGIPKEETFWKKGKQYGAGKWYYKSGKLETFNVTDFYDRVIYVIQYDEQGNKIKEEGVTFSPKFVAEYTNDSIGSPIMENFVKVGKEVSIKITVAEPPQTKTIIKMGELNKNNMKKLPIDNYNTAIYKTTFNESGTHTLITIGEIKDLNGSLIKRDSTAINIIVAN
jgi:antitoxin component YwqK of YwqJK toxin-antitoxin module